MPRDPERPKTPPSAYLRFAAELREKKNIKQMKEIGQAWRDASSVEKQRFEQMAAPERAAYKRQFEEYKASGKFDAFKRDPAKPMKPLTAYFQWAAEQRKGGSFANQPVAEAAKALGAGWKNVPAEKKAPLQAQYVAQMEQYKTKMAAYKESGANEKWLAQTGRLEVMKKAEAKKQAEKDKLLQAKLKLKAQADKAKEKLAADKAATKAKADKAKAAAKAKAAKAKAAKEKSKEQLAAKRAKAKPALALKKAKAAALAKKRVLAADKKKASDKAKAAAAAEKKKAKAAADKKKATKAAADKKKAKAAADTKKAKTAAGKKAAATKATAGKKSAATKAS